MDDSLMYRSHRFDALHDLLTGAARSVRDHGLSNPALKRRDRAERGIEAVSTVAPVGAKAQGADPT